MGFWTLASPVLGLINMFLSISDWHYYNWDDTSCRARIKKVFITIVQLLMMGFLYVELFVWNTPPTSL
jgi:hypothetical protein